jgi:hypothetical protein
MGFLALTLRRMVVIVLGIFFVYRVFRKVYFLYSTLHSIIELSISRSSQKVMEGITSYDIHSERDSNIIYPSVTICPFYWTQVTLKVNKNSIVRRPVATKSKGEEVNDEASFS